MKGVPEHSHCMYCGCVTPPGVNMCGKCDKTEGRKFDDIARRMAAKGK